MNSDNLKEYVGASTTDDAYVAECWETAQDLVLGYANSYDVPVSVLERCFLEVGSELFHRRSAPMGIAQYASYDGTPLRIARDPLIGAYPILNKYMVRFA